jgi:Phosphomethylpyrimidine kinase
MLTGPLTPFPWHKFYGDDVPKNLFTITTTQSTSSPTVYFVFVLPHVIPLTMSIPRVLVIAGSDSSGGAGLEADQKVLAAHGVYAMTATTALTAQNTLSVEDIHVVPAEFVAKQLRQVLGDIGCDVVKMGMYEVRKHSLWS